MLNFQMVYVSSIIEMRKMSLREVKLPAWIYGHKFLWALTEKNNVSVNLGHCMI